MNKQIIADLGQLIKRNKKVIDAIDSGKDINIQKAVKACMISNNTLAEKMIDFIWYLDKIEDPVSKMKREFTDKDGNLKIKDLLKHYGEKH